MRPRQKPADSGKHSPVAQFISFNTAPAIVTTPDILTHAGPLLERYRVLLCDVWGVVHNGVTPHDTACAALKAFRQGGGSVILLTNAPVPKFQVQAMLDRVGVPDGIADDIVSSGEIALRHIKDQHYTSVFCIGPEDRDAAFFKRSTAASVPLDKAEAVVATGLNDDRNETADSYRELLAAALDRNLPFVCANPDLVVDVGGARFFCAGAIGDLYETMGGTVYWAGKPHNSAYETARACAETIQGTALKPEDFLVIGDALRTDIEGAKRAGLDALFVTGGIHRDDVVIDGVTQPDKLAALMTTPDTPPVLAAMTELAW